MHVIKVQQTFHSALEETSNRRNKSIGIYVLTAVSNYSMYPLSMAYRMAAAL